MRRWNLPNQTYPGTATPIAATVNGDGEANGKLVFLSLIHRLRPLSNIV